MSNVHELAKSVVDPVKVHFFNRTLAQRRKYNLNDSSPPPPAKKEKCLSISINYLLFINKMQVHLAF